MRTLSEIVENDNGWERLNLPADVLQIAKQDPESLNWVYKEICEKLGMDTAVDIYLLFMGQQITFPMRFFSSEYIRKAILREFDGTNIKKLAGKYGYSEKTVRRIIREVENL